MISHLYFFVLLIIGVIKFNRIKQYTMYLVFLIPFLPRYIGISIGGSSLSLYRLLLAMLLFSFLIIICNKSARNRFLNQVKRARLLSITILVWYFIGILSILLNGVSVSGFVYYLDDFFKLGLIYFVFIFLIRDKKDVEDFERVIFYSYLLVMFICILDILFNYKVYSIFGNSNINFKIDFNDVRMRDDTTRISSSFNNPVLLGLYLSSLYPLVANYILYNYKTIWVFVFTFILIPLIYYTDSRSSLALILLSAILFIDLYFFKMFKKYRFIIALFNIIFLIFALVIYVTSISSKIESFTGYLDYSSSKERSVYGRALQYEKTVESLYDNEFFGNGKIEDMGRFLDDDFGAIDNRFLIVLYEYGYFGFSVYMLFNILILYSLYKKYLVHKYYMGHFISGFFLFISQIITALPILLGFYLFVAVSANVKNVSNGCKENS